MCIALRQLQARIDSLGVEGRSERVRHEQDRAEWDTKTKKFLAVHLEGMELKDEIIAAARRELEEQQDVVRSQQSMLAAEKDIHQQLSAEVADLKKKLDCNETAKLTVSPDVVRRFWLWAHMGTALGNDPVGRCSPRTRHFHLPHPRLRFRWHRSPVHPLRGVCCKSFFDILSMRLS